MSKPYSPNHIPAAERFINILYSLVLIGLAGLGLWTGELLLPGKRTSGPTGMALSGLTAGLMYGAMLCACAVLLSVVADHYDRRDNEISYRRFAQTAKWIGWILFAGAMVLYAVGVGTPVSDMRSTRAAGTSTSISPTASGPPPNPIVPTAPIRIKGSNVTISAFGDTTPGGTAYGVTIRDHGLILEGAQHVVVRNVAIRNPSYADDVNQIGGGIRITRDTDLNEPSSNILLQNISVTDFGDSQIDITDSHDITIAYATLGSDDPYHPRTTQKIGDMGTGNKWYDAEDRDHYERTMMINRGYRITLHHNMFLGAHIRNPMVKTEVQLAGSPALDMRNNIVSGWLPGQRRGPCPARLLHRQRHRQHPLTEERNPRRHGFSDAAYDHYGQGACNAQLAGAWHYNSTANSWTQDRDAAIVNTYAAAVKAYCAAKYPPS